MTNNGFLVALSHPIRRRIIDSLTKKDQPFVELMKSIDLNDHGQFGYHLRALRGFIRLHPSTKEYCLTNRGLLLSALISSYQYISLLNKQYEKYVRKLRMGDHAVAFFNSEDFKRGVSFPYIDAGLARNEAVIYLVSENKLDVEEKEIQRYGIDFDKYRKGAFSMLSAEEWYLERGEAQAEKIISNCLELLKEKEILGFEGLRMVGETGAFFDCAKHLELWRYEELLGTQLRFNMCGLCLYAMDALNEYNYTRIHTSHGHIISTAVLGEVNQ